MKTARWFGTSARRRIELEHAAHTMEAARDIALALGDETDLDRVLELIATRARALVDAHSLLIWLVDDDTLQLVAHAGGATPPPGASVPLEGSTAGTALQTGMPMRIDDASTGLSIEPGRYGLSNARSALIVPLIFRGRGLGVLAAFDHAGSAATFSDGDERVLQSFAASAATAVATAHSVEAQRLRDSIAAAEGERRRWARDLHDETLQGLGAVKLALAASLWGDPSAARARVEGAVVQLESEVAALRGIIADLRPPALDELGLEPALRTLAARVADHGLPVTAGLGLGDRRLEPELETISYRIAQEALTNALKHAHATRAWLDLTVTASILEVCVRDDGRGFDARAASSSGGYGITGMRERTEIGHGHLRVVSRAGEGTTVTLTLPLP